MPRVNPTVMVVIAVVVSLVACGDNPAALSPHVNFVGNATCPTDGVSPYDPSPPNVNSQPPVGQAIDEMSHSHVEPPAKVTYMHDPPTSGCHYNLAGQVAPIKAGVYNSVVPAEYWVHNLEHGYIAVLYNCPSPPGCDADFALLRDWYNSIRNQPDPNNSPLAYAKVIILPWSSMKPKFAAVAWDWYDPMSSLNLAEIKRFYANHATQGPEGPNAQ